MYHFFEFFKTCSTACSDFREKALECNGKDLSHENCPRFPHIWVGVASLHENDSYSCMMMY